MTNIVVWVGCLYFILLAQIVSASHNISILVLGAGGLVGQPLVQELTSRGYQVIQVKNRLDVDLRVLGSLSAFDYIKIDFAFFLACEVGGSKFLSSASSQHLIWQFNLQIYDNVFPYLEKRNISYLFASSQLAVQPSAYGRVKLLGENRTLGSRFGKAFRFWNVYGSERIGMKSHVIADWVYQCASRGSVQSLTNGNELRQFSHTMDVAPRLVDMMESFGSLQRLTDVASSEWMTLREVADTISSLKRCNFTFASSSSSNIKGIEPHNVWRVESIMKNRIFEMLQYYERQINVGNQSAPYLSIIICTSNDKYNGIRTRTNLFLQSLSAGAATSHLDYELIVVQYNPSLVSDYFNASQYGKETYDRDLPWSQLFPWTTSSRGKVRIITVPSHLHQWHNKGHVWEYIGKNVGALRSKGRFLLFTNPDDIFPHALMDRIAKQQLDASIVYRAGMILNFDAKGSNYRAATAKCDGVASLAYFCMKDAMRCPLPVSERNLFAGYKYVDFFIGDFSIFGRQKFLDSAGYLEQPQNIHVESSHLQYYLRKVQPASKVKFLDESTCHMSHERLGRPEAQWSINELRSMYSERNISLRTFGFTGQTLPEADMSNIMAAGYNPETPHLLHAHNPLMHVWAPHLWMGPLEKDFLVDFVGVKTNYSFDCDDWKRYRFFHLSRRIPCDRHDVFIDQGLLAADLIGDLPIIDEEYFEWLSLLRAVDRATHRDVSSPFVVAEFGARYGTWIVRGARAMQRLQPQRSIRLAAIEADRTGYEWLQKHLETNGFTNSSTTWRGFVSDQKTNVSFAGWETNSPAKEIVNTYTIHELLADYSFIDIMHVDIQGSESVFIQNMEYISKRVACMHIGTHSHDIHRRLKEAFTAHEWTIVDDMMPNNGVRPGRIEQTQYGPIRFLWDGILTIENSKLQSSRS